LELLRNSEYDTPEKWFEDEYGDSHSLIELCPFGVPGDKLIVKESWNTLGKTKIICYKSDVVEIEGSPKALNHPWRSPVTMPRWASRYTLDLLSVRVERVQDIESQERYGIYYLPGVVRDFANFWNSHNPKYPWESNPWIWCWRLNKRRPYGKETNCIKPTDGD